MSCMMHNQWKYFPFQWMRLVTRRIKSFILWSWLPTMMGSAPHGDLSISKPCKMWNRQPIRRIPPYGRFVRLLPPMSASKDQRACKDGPPTIAGTKSMSIPCMTTWVIHKRIPLLWPNGWYVSGFEYTSYQRHHNWVQIVLCLCSTYPQSLLNLLQHEKEHKHWSRWKLFGLVELGSNGGERMRAWTKWLQKFIWG